MSNEPTKRPSGINGDRRGCSSRWLRSFTFDYGVVVIMSNNKCNFVNGGYADEVCNALAESVEGGRQTKKSKGIYTGSIVNFKTHERLGIQIKLKSGDFIENGICLNFCPFCGGQVRDMSED